MADIKEKIAKLLALADSPNENEAKAALLKARKLMAEHKLRPEECQGENRKVIIRTIGITCTKMTDAWAVPLSGTIASHYCCKAFRRRNKEATKVEIGFSGLQDDFEVCKNIFLYAHKCVKERCKEITRAQKKKNWPAKMIREMCNAYGDGFCRGLQAAYVKQSQEHQEWGLAMVLPPEVVEKTAYMGPPKPFAEIRTDEWREMYMRSGLVDGQKFDPGHRLGGKTERVG